MLRGKVDWLHGRPIDSFADIDALPSRSVDVLNERTRSQRVLLPPRFIMRFLYTSRGAEPCTIDGKLRARRRRGRGPKLGRPRLPFRIASLGLAHRRAGLDAQAPHSCSNRNQVIYRLRTSRTLTGSRRAPLHSNRPYKHRPTDPMIIDQDEQTA